MKKVIAAILLVFVTIFGYFSFSPNSTPFSPVLSQNSYLVNRVVDGDTIEINYNSQKEKVRLIGIDTPETVKPNTPVQAFGKNASEFTKSVLLNNYITLEFDEQKRDKYDRLLAYVYINGEMFNKTLLSNGLARVSTFPPNTKYVDDFIQIENTVKTNRVGLWEDYSDSTVSEVNAEYIANSSTMKIHLLSCSYANGISSYNKVYFDNLDYPLNNGYIKCTSCFK